MEERIARLEAALRLIIDKAPTEEPTWFETDNHGDSMTQGSLLTHFYLAEIARVALEEE